MTRLPSRGLLAAAALLPLLTGACSTVVMDPAGDVARQQSSLILWSTGLMLLIIVPVMVLTVLFAWRYRAGGDAEYDPDFDHSTGLELVIWSAPLLIIIALGALTWLSTHTLDPYRPLSRIAAGKPVPKNQRPLEVQVVALDWKWLFIYPEQGIATVNELVVPVNRQVRFRLTSSDQMNTFWVPTMAGMIYSMPGMETALHAVLNRTGRFEGRSANYSGAGFSGMTFWTHSLDQAGFDRWVAGVRRQPLRLDRASYLKLAKPSEKVKPIGFGAVDPALYDRVVRMCVKPGVPCMDMSQGHGHGAGTNNRAPQPGEAEGALLRDPDEKGTSPHLSAPHGEAPGEIDRGADANRNLTSLDAPVLPGAAAIARG